MLGRATLDLAAVRSALEQRLPADPRLRRRLVRVPPGFGRPLWVDHPDFDITEHVMSRKCSRLVTRDHLLDLAAELVADPLPMDRPLWRATLVPEVERGCAALVVVFHHVLADGMAGLTLLDDLLTPGPAPLDPCFPRPRPPRRDLVLDALRERFGWLRRLPASVLRLSVAAAELGPSLGARAQACSLNQPAGPRRIVRIVDVDLPELVGVAHQHGVTVNDVILTAVAGALGRLLVGRGERVPCLVVSVPFAAQSGAGRSALGNHSGAVPVRLPTLGAFTERLATTAASTRRAKQRQRGASTALLGPALRLLDRLGLYQRFINHQRMVHTFVSNVTGPAEALELLGHPLLELIPLSRAAGNVTVAFTALSYRGRLVLAVNADPDTCPDIDRLVAALGEQLAADPA